MDATTVFRTINKATKPAGFSSLQWQQLQQKAANIWSSFLEKGEVPARVEIPCKEFYQLFTTETGANILDRNTLIFIQNDFTADWSEEMLAKAREFHKMGNLKKCKEFIGAAFFIQPLNFKALILRAQVKQNDLDFSGALHDYSQAILLEPHNEFAYLKRGALNEQLQFTHSALDDYSNAVKANPFNAFALLKRGELKMALDLDGDHDIKLALQLKPALQAMYVQKGGRLAA